MFKPNIHTFRWRLMIELLWWLKENMSDSPFWCFLPAIFKDETRKRWESLVYFGAYRPCNFIGQKLSISMRTAVWCLHVTGLTYRVNTHHLFSLWLVCWLKFCSVVKDFLLIKLNETIEPYSCCWLTKYMTEKKIP